MAPGPLAGVKVLEFSQIVAGPYCGMILADMGADVVKFEPLEGEALRLVAPMVPGESRGFASLNRGKRSVAIDMGRPEARDVFDRLVPAADVVAINYRPGVAERLGLQYERLHAINPRLIYCENTAFGREGPLAGRGGYDIIVQALTGLMATEIKMAGDVPGYITPPVADFATGIQMANGICAALYAREKTGRGQRIDCTLMASAMGMLTTSFTWFESFDGGTIPPLLEGLEKTRAEQMGFMEQVRERHRHRPLPPANIYYRVYQTADGLIALAAFSLPLRQRMLAVLGLSDPRIAADGSFGAAPEGWDSQTLVTAAEALFRTRTTAQWDAAFEAEGVPAGPVHFIEELFDHPQVLANGLVAELEHPLLGKFRMVGPPLQMSETKLAAHRASPVLGADTDAVLREAGFTDEEITALRAVGVVR